MRNIFLFLITIFTTTNLFSAPTYKVVSDTETSKIYLIGDIRIGASTTTADTFISSHTSYFKTELKVTTGEGNKFTADTNYILFNTTSDFKDDLQINLNKLKTTSAFFYDNSGVIKLRDSADSNYYGLSVGNLLADGSIQAINDNNVIANGFLRTYGAGVNNGKIIFYTSNPLGGIIVRQNQLFEFKNYNENSFEGIKVASITFSDGTAFTSSSTVIDNLLASSNTWTGENYFNGGIKHKITTVIDTYTITTADYFILIDPTTNKQFAINLPTASGITGKCFVIKINSVEPQNEIVVDASGAETIEGNPTISLVDAFDEILIISDGSNWLFY